MRYEEDISLEQELLREYLTPRVPVLNHKQTPFILISADMAGCGSTTLARKIYKRLYSKDSPTRLILIGNMIRSMLDMHGEVSARGFEKVPSTESFDKKIYMEMVPEDGAIIEGKHATSIGFEFLTDKFGNEKIYLLNLTNREMFSVIRVLRREGIELNDILDKPAILLSYLKMLEERNIHIKMQVKDNNVPHGPIIDTSLFSSDEIISQIFGDYSWLYDVPEWEINSLLDTLDRLERIYIKSKRTESKDAGHYEFARGRVKYMVANRLMIIRDPFTLINIRKDIRDVLEQAVLALLNKRSPRFGVKGGDLIIDRESRQWTPSYYKLASVLPMLRRYIDGKIILDPFGGSASLSNALKMLCTPKEVIVGDLSYTGGKQLNDALDFYLPELNTQILFSAFDKLPSWYKPKPLRQRNTFITHDVKELPFASNSMDLVVTDPPYKINLDDGGCDFFFESLPEIMRVVKEGGLFIIPMSWLPEFDNRKIKYVKMTDDISRGNSHVPVCWIMIKKNDFHLLNRSYNS